MRPENRFWMARTRYKRPCGMSKKWRLNSEWRFDTDLDDCARARLIEALKPVVSRSFSDTHKELRNCLAKHPELNHEASLRGTELIGQGLVGKLH